jgi:glycosyltransferase A (GT-A) superfamily protein (DUF2064 family)
MECARFSADGVDGVGPALTDTVRAELARAALTVALDSVRPVSDFLSDAMLIFHEIYALSGDSEEALAEADAWLHSHPMLQREGPRSYVASWVFFKRPEWWDG